MPYPSCTAHADFPRQNCMDCHAKRSSVTLRAIESDLDDARRAAPTPAEQGEWDRLQREYPFLGWRDRKVPTNVVDELDRLIEEWCRGDVS